jgi:uncharacterized membrane protein YphA (DoxX/SURF4 family)
MQNGEARQSFECPPGLTERRSDMTITTRLVTGFRDNRWLGPVTLYLRIALAAGFLSPVADRFGLWGPPGTPQVAWGNFHNFLAYTGRLNPWFPLGWIPAVGWTATICEVALGAALLIGYRTRLAALLSGLLTLAFAVGMVFGVNIQAPLNYSVFAVSAGAFLLAEADVYPLSLDNWRTERGPQRRR